VNYYMASVSWAKDSTAMLLKLLDTGSPIDEVVFYDTGMEFQAIYNTRDKILPLLAAKGVTYKELHPDQPFLYDVSCWCCCNKNLKELKNIKKLMPDYWEKLKKLQMQMERPMKGFYKGEPRGVFELDARFSAEIEKEAIKNENH